MPTLEQDFQAYLETERLKEEFAQSEAFKRYQAEIGQGGAIREATGEPFRPPPYGAVVGGAAGTLLGGPVAGVAGTLAGEATQQLVERALGSPAAPQSTEEAAQRLTGEALIQTAGEGAGRLLGRGAARVAAPFSSQVTPEATAALRVLEPKTAQGLLPAEATSSRILDILQNISESSLFGGGAIKRFRENRTAVFQQMADEMVDAFGPRLNPDQMGRAVVDTIQRNKEVATIPARMQYEAIERAAAPEYVPQLRGMRTKKTATLLEGEEGAEAEAFPDVTTTIRDVQVGERLERVRVMTTTGERQISGARIDLSPLQESIAGAVKVAKQAGGLSDREMGNTLLKFIADKPEIVSYPVAKQLRTEIRTLRDVLQKTPETKNAPAIGKANRIYDDLTRAIRKGLAEEDPFLAQQWDEANLVERGANLQFANRITQKLITKAAERNDGSIEQIGDKIFAGGLSTIRKAKNAVADETVWNQVLAGKLSQIFQASQKDGVLNGQKLEAALFGPDGIGQQAMVTAFGPQRTETYRAFINALKVAQQKPVEGTGRILIQLTQGGALLNLAGNVTGLADTGFEAESGFILLGPPVLAQLMTHPQSARWLIQGLQTPSGTPAAAGLVGRLLSAAFPRPSPVETATTPERARLRSGTPGLAPVRPMEVQP